MMLSHAFRGWRELVPVSRTLFTSIPSHQAFRTIPCLYDAYRGVDTTSRSSILNAKPLSIPGSWLLFPASTPRNEHCKPHPTTPNQPHSRFTPFASCPCQLPQLTSATLVLCIVGLAPVEPGIGATTQDVGKGDQPSPHTR